MGDGARTLSTDVDSAGMAGISDLATGGEVGRDGSDAIVAVGVSGSQPGGDAGTEGRGAEGSGSLSERDTEGTEKGSP